MPDPEELDEVAGSPLPMVCGCGSPMSRNPHPEAGTVSGQGDHGYAYECIPCLIRTRNRVGRQMRAAQAVCREVIDVDKRGVVHVDRSGALRDLLAPMAKEALRAQ